MKLLSLPTVIMLLLLAFGDAFSDDAQLLDNREAIISVHPQERQTWGEIWQYIGSLHDVQISLEGLPEDCVGDVDYEEHRGDPFPIAQGAEFTDTIRRFEAWSGNRFMLDKVQGISILRANPEVVTERNFLDTTITLEVENVTVWEALCALAREMNAQAGPIDELAGKYVFVTLSVLSDGYLPDPRLTEEARISLNLTKVSAREALCAIVQNSQMKSIYYYNCITKYDYISYASYNAEGKVARGPRSHDREDVEHWSDENIKRIQVGEASSSVEPAE